ncbi:MAG: YraN family protein [Coriobacteriia bacterium]|nr:YraN family protein [Coriobacteriia bacterium]
MSKKSLKSRGEDAAAAYLERCGICVVERSWHCDAGVIDIIAFDVDTLVVVDVKTRRAAQQVGSQAVTPAVTRRVIKLAEAYLEYAELQDKAWRYDRIELLVISEDRALLRHHRDALNA